MKLPAPPIVSDTDFERLLKLERDDNTALRHLVEILQASWYRQEAEITRLLTRDVEREKGMVVLRERVSKWETGILFKGNLANTWGGIFGQTPRSAPTGKPDESVCLWCPPSIPYHGQTPIWGGFLGRHAGLPLQENRMNRYVYGARNTVWADLRVRP